VELAGRDLLNKTVVTEFFHEEIVSDGDLSNEGVGLQAELALVALAPDVEHASVPRVQSQGVVAPTLDLSHLHLALCKEVYEDGVAGSRKMRAIPDAKLPELVASYGEDQ